MASVTAALKRLDNLGMVRHSSHAFVELTAQGLEAARRVFSRHTILRRFLEEFLQVSPGNAAQDACAIEHHLSDETIDRIVRWFEFVERCTCVDTSLHDYFRGCSVVHPEKAECRFKPVGNEQHPLRRIQPLSKLVPGESGYVVQIDSSGDNRRRLLDQGVLPGCMVTVLVVGPSDAAYKVLIGKEEIPMTGIEAECILVTDERQETLP